MGKKRRKKKRKIGERSAFDPLKNMPIRDDRELSMLNLSAGMFYRIEHSASAPVVSPFNNRIIGAVNHRIERMYPILVLHISQDQTEATELLRRFDALCGGRNVKIDSARVVLKAPDRQGVSSDISSRGLESSLHCETTGMISSGHADVPKDSSTPEIPLQIPGGNFVTSERKGRAALLRKPGF